MMKKRQNRTIKFTATVIITVINNAISDKNTTYWITVVEWVTKFLQCIKELDIVFSFIGIISYSAVNVSPRLLSKEKLWYLKKLMILYFYSILFIPF